MIAGVTGYRFRCDVTGCGYTDPALRSTKAEATADERAHMNTVHEAAPIPATMGGMTEWSGIIAVEGAPSKDGRLLAPGSLRWEAMLPLPVVDVSAGSSAVVGVLRSATREPGGLIRGYGSVLEGYLPPGTPLAISVDHAVWDDTRTETDPTVTLSSARLRQVATTDAPVWPECVVDQR